MESQLLECLEALSSAGDDERARLRKVSRTVDMRSCRNRGGRS